MATLSKRVDSALGRTPADCVLVNGRVVNVMTAEVLEADVAISGGRIVAVGDLPDGAIDSTTKTVNIAGDLLVPGYIDAHIHVGGSSLPVAALAEALLERGTTAIATDLYELYAMFGVAGVREGIELAERSGLRILFMPPLHLIGLENYGTFAHPPNLSEFLEMMDWPQTIGVNEPPPFVVLRGNNDVLSVIEHALTARKVFEGHAAGIRGTDLQAYAAAGASSDHEANFEDEALEKLRLGYRIIMREGSASRDLPQIAPLLTKYPLSSRFFMVCSDECEPTDLVQNGHVDHKLRELVKAGVDPITAIQIATINAADYFHLADDLGSITPGKYADILVLEDLDTFRPRMVITNGVVVAEEDAYIRGDYVADPVVTAESRVVLSHSPRPDDFRIQTSTSARTTTARVIGLVDGTLVSEALTHECAVIGGYIEPDPENDILSVAVMERHTGSGRIGRGLISGVGFRHGAVAMTYCHVHQNVLVIGVTVDEMTAAVMELQRLGGGIVVASGNDIVASLQLPGGGVLGSGSLEEVHTEFRTVEDAMKSLGCPLSAPILALAFSVLPHIPAYGITDFGLYDADAEKFVEVSVGGQP